MGYDRQQWVPGVYLIKADDRFYVGSTNDLYTRTAKHKSLLNKGQHWLPSLQEAFNASEQVDVLVIPTETKSEAVEVEQQLLDSCRGSGLLFNVASDANASQTGRPLDAERIEKLKGPRPAEVAQKVSATRRSQSKAIMVEGVWYENIYAVMDAFNLTYNAIYLRVTSDSEKFRNWNWAD